MASSLNRGLYRLRDAMGTAVVESYDLDDIEAYLIRRAEEIRGGKPQPRED
jgi:hypothetical protein